jgi:hypothetical protein
MLLAGLLAKRTAKAPQPPADVPAQRTTTAEQDLGSPKRSRS